VRQLHYKHRSTECIFLSIRLSHSRSLPWISDISHHAHPKAIENRCHYLLCLCSSRICWHYHVSGRLAEETCAFQRFRSGSGCRFNTFKNLSLRVLRIDSHAYLSIFISSCLRWPADKSDGLGTTSRISQTTSCDVHGDGITSISNPTFDNIRAYFNEAMSACTSQIPANRKKRTLIFLGTSIVM
jgi:hypothetical protein